MTPTADEPPLFRRLRERSEAEDGVFWNGDDELCVFDGEAAQRFSRVHYRDLTLGDRLVDLLRRRRSAEVSWREVRGGWLERLHALEQPAAAGELAGRMEAILAERLDRPGDLVTVAQAVCSRSLVPTVIGGLGDRDRARIERDQDVKIEQILLSPSGPGPTLRDTLRSFAAQIAAGWVVRRELRRRASGRRPRRGDLCDPLVDLLPRLGMDRAVDSLTAVLTAIAGPPGSAAACLLYELARRPEWVERMGRELAPLAPGDLAADPAGAAPATHRFVRESLRVWSLPLLMVRPIETETELGSHSLAPGQRVLVSPFFTHRDRRHWRDPESFDPDRWLAEAEGGGCPRGAPHYVPFGWAPRSCIGAGLGLLQLMIFCRLVCVDYRIEPARPEAVRVELATVPLIHGFDGIVRRR